MMYMYNVWVNWWPHHDLEPSILEYYEWKKTDRIEKLERVPVVYVSKQLLSYLSQYDAIMPKKIAKTIYNRTFVMKDNQRIVYPYACIVSNKKEALAIQWDAENRLWKKSRLTPKQERYIKHSNEQTSTLKWPFSVQYLHKGKNLDRATLGLTRTEKEKRSLLLAIFRQIKATASAAELNYWYKEWDYAYQAEKDLSNYLTIKTNGNKLYQALSHDWSKQHDLFLNKIFSYYMNVYKHEPINSDYLIKTETKKCYEEYRSTL